MTTLSFVDGVMATSQLIFKQKRAAVGDKTVM